MNKALIVVDMQNDFITGSLKNENADWPAAIDFINKKIDEFHEMEDGGVIFTRDTHFKNYLDTQEGKNLPVEHCLMGTEGWEITDALHVNESDAVIDKNQFGYENWRQYLRDVDEVFIVGTVSEICVVSNALAIKAAAPNVVVHILEKGCVGLTEENHDAAMKVMASCQCDIIKD